MDALLMVCEGGDQARLSLEKSDRFQYCTDSPLENQKLV